MIPQDLPKHSRNEQITAKFGSLAQEASLSDAIFPPLLSGPVAARRYTTLGDLTTRIAFSENYFQLSLLRHSLFIKKVNAVKNDKKKSTFRTFDAASRFVAFVTLMFYLPLTPASKPQTNTRVRETNEEDRQRKVGWKKKHTYCVVVLNSHSVFVSFTHWRKRILSRAPLLSFVHFTLFHISRCLPQTHRHIGEDRCASRVYTSRNVCTRARARTPSGAIITMHVIVGYRLSWTRYSYLTVLSARIVTIESQGISAAEK